MEYNKKNIEKKWQDKWNSEKTFVTNIKKDNVKKYIVPMFPYPSGNIHMGHMRNYTISDVIARYWRQQGYNVCHTIGWDSFGMPAETAAIDKKVHPKDWTNTNISNMKQQMIEMGMSFDWSKEISTCESEYWKNEQEFFIDMWDAGFIERKVGIVNWDPVDKSVIANEQVINGRGWRSGAIIEKKEMTQYYFKTTMFKDDMIDSIREVTNYWPDIITKQQIQFMSNGIVNGDKVNPFSDWCISRQRYWGTPIPMIHCNNCGVIPNRNFPIEAPQDVEFDGIGNPISNHPTWKYCKCPICGLDAEKECDTMDTFVQSSWYFIRYISDIKNKKFDTEAVKYWFPIDYYIGGPEHATSHLIYARFFWRIFKRIGYIPNDIAVEPFKNIITQGMVKNMGKKMSKSAGNGISPIDIVDKWGCDTIRMYIMFAGPIDQDIDWDDSNIIGCYRFINKIWNAHIRIKEGSFNNTPKPKEDSIANQKIENIRNRRKNIYENTMRFNTIIAYSMETYNAISKTDNINIWKNGIYEIMESIGPIVPHIYEEIKENIF